VCPSPPMLIAEIANTARSFAPAQIGVADSAIKIRQSNPKTEFVRAFLHNLKECGLELQSGHVVPVCVLLNVAFNSSEIDITEDDLKKQLKWLP